MLRVRPAGYEEKICIDKMIRIILCNKFIPPPDVAAAAEIHIGRKLMKPQLWFFTSVAFSFLAWGIVGARYIWPALRARSRAEALRPLLVLNTFRFLGLSFLVPGVVSPDLPSTFAHAAAYGDLIAAILALFSLLSLESTAGTAMIWIFNLWGAADLLNAFYQGNHAALLPGQLGATYFIPTFGVPLFLIVHGLIFRILLQRQSEATVRELAVRSS
jgi:hypothetical protein